MSVVKLNNELRELEIQERKEIEAVLADLSNQAAEHSGELEQNFRLLGEMHRLGELGYPVLAGISRKSMIYKTLDTTPDDALAGTTALHWECLRQGASILRVHDTREAAQIVALYERYEQSNDR